MLQAGGGMRRSEGWSEEQRKGRKKGRGETPSCGETAPTSAGAASEEAASSSCWNERCHRRPLPPFLPPPHSALRRRWTGTSGGCRRSGGRSQTWPVPGVRGGRAEEQRRIRCSSRVVLVPTGPAAGAGGADERPLEAQAPVSILGSP